MSALPKFSNEDRYGSLSVSRFAKWWLNNRPINPPDDCMAKLGGLSGIILYREGPFQVQLFLAPVRADIPNHTHPNVDSIEMHLAGKVELSIRGDQMKDNGAFDGFLTVGHNDEHYGYMENGAFYSFQKWLNGKPESSIGLDWSGVPVDSDHAQALSA